MSHLTITHGKSTNGGGIANPGILTVTDSTLRGNTGTDGACVYNTMTTGNLTLTNSTLWNNQTQQLSI